MNFELEKLYEQIANHGTVEQILTFAQASPFFRSKYKRAIAIAKSKRRKKEKSAAVMSQFHKT